MYYQQNKDRHRNHIFAKFGVFVEYNTGYISLIKCHINHALLLILIHTETLSKRLTSCPTTIKSHVIKYCDKVYKRKGKNLFWSIKNSGEGLVN